MKPVLSLFERWRFLLTSKVAKPVLSNNVIKLSVNPVIAFDMSLCDRYLAVEMIKMKDVKDDDLHSFISLEEV